MVQTFSLRLKQEGEAPAWARKKAGSLIGLTSAFQRPEGLCYSGNQLQEES